MNYFDVCVVRGCGDPEMSFTQCISGSLILFLVAGSLHSMSKILSQFHFFILLLLFVCFQVNRSEPAHNLRLEKREFAGLNGDSLDGGAKTTLRCANLSKSLFLFFNF